MSRFNSKDPIKQQANNQVVSNLRQNHKVFDNYTDQQVFDAWDSWSESEDYPDESKIVDYFD